MNTIININYGYGNCGCSPWFNYPPMMPMGYGMPMFGNYGCYSKGALNFGLGMALGNGITNLTGCILNRFI